MSKGARITVAVVTLIAAVCFVLIGVGLGSDLPAGPWPFYGLGAFCGIIATACLVRRSRPVTLRIIGMVIFVSYAVYALTSIHKPNAQQALLAFLVLGLPSGYLALTGGYPSWGRAAAAFRSEQTDENDIDR